MSNKKLVIYHKNCADGFGAAYAAWKRLGDSATYLPMGYEDDMQLTEDQVVDVEIYIVDFSFPPAQLVALAAVAKSVAVLDHHKSFIADWAKFLEDSHPHEIPKNLAVVLDLNRSGAMITWKYFFDGDAPPLLYFIQDRDLWRFALPDTKQVYAALMARPMEFKIWDGLMFDTQTLAMDDAAILMKHQQEVKNILAQPALTLMFMTETDIPDVPVVNCSYHYASDIGQELAKDFAFGATFVITSKGVQFSLRSQPDKVDVSLIAKRFGGGGHRNAAGFVIPLFECIHFCGSSVIVYPPHDPT